MQPANKLAQFMAFVFIPFVVIVALTGVTVAHGLLEEILLQDTSGGQRTILAFLVTLGSLAFFAGAMWFVFLWVRTGGLGLFEVGK